MQQQLAKINRALAHRSELPLALGCAPCPLLPQCGGLRVSAGVFSCDSFCTCRDRTTCPYVCRNKGHEYVLRFWEVNGFDLDGIPNAPTVPAPALPLVVPLVYGGSHLLAPLPATVAAVPMYRLFHVANGQARDSSREQLATRLGLRSEAALVVSGVSTEQPIEHYWSRARKAGFLERLAALRPELVTTPNFSLFSNVPREDNLYNMKRLALCWYELAALKIPTALHVNARTDRDWERWAQFLVTHPEINLLAFEFRTGAVYKDRGRWYAGKLANLARRMDRELHLVLRGGRRFLAELRRSFHAVVFLTPTPFLKTQKRQRLTWHAGERPEWQAAPTARGQRLDPLFRHNLQAFAAMVSAQTADASC